MEKRYYDYNYFIEHIISKLPLIADCFEAEIYKSGTEIWKIFHYHFCDRNEINIENIGKLNGDYLTIPIALF